MFMEMSVGADTASLQSDKSQNAVCADESDV